MSELETNRAARRIFMAEYQRSNLTMTGAQAEVGVTAVQAALEMGGDNLLRLIHEAIKAHRDELTKPEYADGREDPAYHEGAATALEWVEREILAGKS